MIYPHVNLLKKNERRYQGVVSRRFIFVGIVVVPILLVSMLSAAILFKNEQVQGSLADANKKWSELKGPQDECIKLQKMGGQNKLAVDLLSGWGNSQPDLEQVLFEMQKVIPPRVQITRMSISVGGDVAVFGKVEDFAMRPTLMIQGFAKENVEGETRAEDEVLKKLLPALNSNEFLVPLFKKFELLPGPKKKNEVFEFKIESRGL